MTPERLRKIKTVLAQRQSGLTVILHHVHKQRNHAAILRTCDAVGIQRMIVVGDRSEHRPYRGTAMGSQQWVDVEHRDSIGDAITAAARAGQQVVVADGGTDSVSYRDIDYRLPTAVVMGAEKAGASDEALRLADRRIKIPMLGMVESYNVSVAAAIILNEAREQRSVSGIDADRLDPNAWRSCFFRWGYPRLASFCDARDIPYPELDEHGDIVDPDGHWRALAKNRER